ncbi:hypothetical protein Tco_0168308 [Tanacetum coccineum]
MVWIQIVKAISNLKEKGVDLLSFWDQPLKFWFPRLFALETNKLISVAERKRQGIGLDSFRRPPKGVAESTQWEEMLELLNTVHLSSMADRCAWSLLGREPISWCNFFPIKINVMAWRLSLDKLPTHLNLDAHNIDVPTVYVLIVQWWDLDVPILNSYIQWWQKLFECIKSGPLTAHWLRWVDTVSCCNGIQNTREHRSTEQCFRTFA